VAVAAKILPLVAALALAGAGIGTTVVPATSSALTAVPAERSGMAVSAANTSRGIGAAIGVAVLGAPPAAACVQWHAMITNSKGFAEVRRACGQSALGRGFDRGRQPLDGFGDRERRPGLGRGDRAGCLIAP
jgi:hypothetical protein